MIISFFNLLEEKNACFCEAHQNSRIVNVIGLKYNNINC